MEEEKKTFSRRSFLKGAAAVGLVSGASGTGLFVKEAQAAALTRAVQEPPGVTEDTDVKGLADNLAEASIQGAYDSFNSAFEKFVKGREDSLDVGKALGATGLKLISSEARGAAKSHRVPPSIQKVRQLQLKQKGWHVHVSACAFGYCWHGHVSW